MPKAIAFQQILETLKDDKVAFPTRQLANFSDLTPDQLKQFKRAWPEVPVERKRTLMQRLVDRLDEDFLVSYDEVAKAVLHDDDAEVRRCAIRMLWESQDPRMIPDLLTLLRNDVDESVRAEAASVLGIYIYLGELEELADHLRTQIEEGLLTATAEGQPALVRRKAMEALGFSSRPEADKIVAAGFEHRDPLWQASALFAMGRSGDNRWDEAVLSALNHDVKEVQLAAVEAAGQLSLGAARSFLLNKLEDEEDEEIFRATIWSLSQIGGEDVRTYLENLLDKTESDDDIDFIEEALENLTFTEDLERFDILALNADDEEDLLESLLGDEEEPEADEKPKRSKKPKK